MKKVAMVAGVVGAVALAAAVWAQQGPPGGGPQQGAQGFGERMRERFAQRFHGGPGGGEMRGPGGMDRGEILRHVIENPEMAKKVGITGEQIEKIKEGEFAFEKQMIQLRADAEATKLEVRHLMEADKVDRDAVSKAIDAAGAKELALRKAGLLRELDVKETLGKETIEKIRGAVREHMMQRGGQGGPGPQGQGGGNQNARPWLRGQMPPPEKAPGA